MSTCTFIALSWRMSSRLSSWASFTEKATITRSTSLPTRCWIPSLEPSIPSSPMSARSSFGLAVHKAEEIDAVLGMVEELTGDQLPTSPAPTTSVFCRKRSLRLAPVRAIARPLMTNRTAMAQNETILGGFGL